MTRFLLIRHGSTDMLDVGISGWAPDVPLSAAGRDEAMRLARRLSQRTIDVLYTSPLDRTRQTAAIVAEAVGLVPQLSAAIGELRFGAWTGRSFEALTGDPIWQRFNRFRSGTRIPDGELMLETQVRSVAALLDWQERHEGKTVALVTHGDVIKSVITYFLGMPLDLHSRLEVAPASVSELELGFEHAKLLGLSSS